MQRNPVRSRLTIALLLVVGLWRLAASLVSEGPMIALAGVDHRMKVWTASREQRLRWALLNDYPVYTALRPLAGETPRIYVYGAATGVPRDKMAARLALLESQLRELLFPARVSAVVGPIPAAALPAMRKDMPPILVANLTPSEPLPDVPGLRVLVRAKGFTLSILEAP